MSKQRRKPEKLEQLRLGDIVRLYPYLGSGPCRYKNNYMIVIWGYVKYNLRTSSYRPLFAIDMEGKRCKTIGVHNDTTVGQISRQDYIELSCMLKNAELTYNIKKKILTRIRHGKDFNDYRPTE